MKVSDNGSAEEREMVNRVCRKEERFHKKKQKLEMEKRSLIKCASDVDIQITSPKTQPAQQKDKHAENAMEKITVLKCGSQKVMADKR